MNRKDLTKDQILLAMRFTKSNKAAARYLNVSYSHYQMWAKRYNEFDGGRTLWEVHGNRGAKGVPKFNTWNNAKRGNWDVLDVIEGRLSVNHFKPEDIKKRMVDEGFLKEECAICGFNERRTTDFKIPLILNFKDGNKNHYNLGNIRFLCYNHYFLYIDDIFNKKDIEQIETHRELFKTSEAINWDLDEYHQKRLRELGFNDSPNPEDEEDPSKYISRG